MDKTWIEKFELNEVQNVKFYGDDKIFYLKEDTIHGYDLTTQKGFYYFNLPIEKIIKSFNLTKNRLILNYGNRKTIIYDLYSKEFILEIRDRYQISAFETDDILLENNFINSKNKISKWESVTMENFKSLNFNDMIFFDDNQIYDKINNRLYEEKYFLKMKNEIYKLENDGIETFIININTDKGYSIDLKDNVLVNLSYNDINDEINYFDFYMVIKFRIDEEINDIEILNDYNDNKKINPRIKYLSKDGNYFISTNDDSKWKIFHYEERPLNKFEIFGKYAMVEFMHHGRNLIEVEDKNGKTQNYNKRLLFELFPVIKNQVEDVGDDQFYLSDYTIKQLDRLIEEIASEKEDITDYDLYEYLG